MKPKTTYNLTPHPEGVKSLAQGNALCRRNTLSSPIIPLGMIRSVENRKIHRQSRMPLGMRPNCGNRTMVAFLRNAKWVLDAIFLPSDASLRDAEHKLPPSPPVSRNLAPSNKGIPAYAGMTTAKTTINNHLITIKH